MRVQKDHESAHNATNVIFCYLMIFDDMLCSLIDYIASQYFLGCFPSLNKTRVFERPEGCDWSSLSVQCYYQNISIQQTI